MHSPRVDGLDGGSTSEGSLEAFELQTSLWELVSQMCPAKELSEVMRIMGHSLVEQACDLHDEASALLEIWRQLREDTEDAVSRVSEAPCLPEPPLARERLVQEIQFLVDHLQQQQQRRQMGGRSVSALSEENRDILDYVARSKEDDYMGQGCGGGSRPMTCSSGGGSRPMTRSSGGGSRPMTRSSGGGSRPTSRYSRVGSRPVSVVSSRDGRETPLRYTPSSEEGSLSSVMGDNLEAVNSMNIDTVVKHLRDVLEEDCAQRRRDILFLQGCLDGEEEHQRAAIAEATRLEPTLQELREFGTRLEKEILHEAKFKSPPPHSLDRAGDRRPSPTAPRPPPPPSQGSHPPAANVVRASRVRRPEPSSHPSSARHAKPPSIVSEHPCVHPIHSSRKGLKTTPTSSSTPSLSNVATPLDLLSHHYHSYGANSHCTHSSSPHADTHTCARSSPVETNSTSTGSSYSKPIT